MTFDEWEQERIATRNYCRDLAAMETARVGAVVLLLVLVLFGVVLYFGAGLR